MHYSADWTLLSEDVKKYVHRWLPTDVPRGVVCIIHGLGEHGGRYNRLATRLVESRYAVFAFDQQGHGLSPEPRGCVASYDSMLGDIRDFLRWSSEEYPQHKPVLFGHSMGGNLVLNYALRDYPQPSGVIASSPMIRAVNGPSRLFESFARLLMRIAPNYRLSSTVVPARLMSDPEEQQELLNDDLFHGQLSLRLGGALLASGRFTLTHADDLATPLLLTHGTNDIRTCPQASAEFATRAGKQCEFLLLPDRLHDPFRDLEKDVAISKFIEFIERCGRGVEA